MKDKTITRAHISDTFSNQFLISHPKATSLLESILKEIFQGLRDNDTLKISSFGTFRVLSKKQRLGRNPKTGKDAVISARKSLSFRSSQILKSKINRKNPSL